MKNQRRHNDKKSSSGVDKAAKEIHSSRTPSSGKSSGRILPRLFSIDPRSLALFRMVLAALLLVDLAIRAGDLRAMYTDDGMFSRAEICRRATSIWNWSFHFGSGSLEYQAGLFILAGALAVALLMGWETRLVTIGSWLMLVSLHHRVPPILSGAENLMRVLLFWAMFLPLQRGWSLDEWLRKRRGDPVDETPVWSAASAAILTQMGLIYLMSAIFKSNEIWWGGEALSGILAHDFYASPPAAYLLPLPGMLKVLTRATFLLEWAAPFLLFWPRWTAWVRLGTVAALAAMHIGIGICLEVGLFSYVSLAGLALFLPAEFWSSRFLSRLFRRSPTDPRPAAAPSMAIKRPPFFVVTQGLCLVFLAFVIALNLSSLPSRPLASLGLERWRNFYPRPWAGSDVGHVWIHPVERRLVCGPRQVKRWIGSRFIAAGCVDRLEQAQVPRARLPKPFLTKNLSRDGLRR